MASPMQNEHDAEPSKSKVKLGFVEEGDRRLLASHYFPSKVGGKPAWLSLDPLPDLDSIVCDSCGGQTVFLIQVYAPLKQDDTFHRTLFIFVCSRETCVKENYNRNFKVLRSQLPLKNSFYSEDPPNEDLGSDDDGDSLSYDTKQIHNLCHVCGIKSSKKCAKCKNVYYCSKEHQSIDWKYEHKKVCGENVQAQAQADTDKGKGVKKDDDHGHGVLLKEFELVTEEEEMNLEKSTKKTEEERWKEYENFMQLPKMKGLAESEKLTEKDLNKAATGESEDDKQFLCFKKRIDIEPTQVLRYMRGGEPLWVSSFNKPTPESIPNCDCGANRIFEFQIMPQLLNYLKVESLDWGTLCVYTCSESCSIGAGYHEEFIWKQDFHGGKDNNKTET